MFVNSVGRYWRRFGIDSQTQRGRKSATMVGAHSARRASAGADPNNGPTIGGSGVCAARRSRASNSVCRACSRTRYCLAVDQPARPARQTDHALNKRRMGLVRKSPDVFLSCSASGCLGRKPIQATVWRAQENEETPNRKTMKTVGKTIGQRKVVR